MIGFSILAAVPRAFAAVPAVVASSVQNKYATGGMTNPSKMVMDSKGNLFIADNGLGALVAIPAGTTTPMVLYSNAGGTYGVAVDQYDDVVLASNYGGNMWFFTAANVASALAGGSIGTPVDLTQAYGFGQLDAYYAQWFDVTVDKNNVVYMSSHYCASSCSTTGNAILAVQTYGAITNTKAGAAGTINVAGVSKLILKNLPNSPTSLAVDTSNHLFYADGVNVYSVLLTASTYTPTAIGSFTKPTGVTVDMAGNLFVVDNSTGLLWEIPDENGTLNPSDQFVVANPPGAYVGVAFDRFGNFYSGDGYTAKSVDKTTLGGANLGALAVGTASANVNVTFAFNTATLAPTVALYQGTQTSTEFKNTFGGSCSTTVTYAAGKLCTVQIAFTPASTGVRKGALVLQTAGGKPIVTAYLSGVGTGAALTLDPGTQTSVTALAAWKSPSAVAMDGAGNMYVADAGTNAVQVISAAGVATATIGSGLNKPQGIAVDGAGNVIIADTGNNRIVEVPNENGTLNTADQSVILPASVKASITALQITSNVVTFTASNSLTAGQVVSISGLSSTAGAALNGQMLTVLATGLSSTSFSANYLASNLTVTSDAGFAVPLMGVNAPVGLAVNGLGRIYVADTGNARVLSVSTGEGLNLPVLGTVGSGYTTPVGLATDIGGNLYITDSSTGQINEYSLATGTQSVALKGALSAPTSIAIDAAGSAYVVNTGNATVVRIPNVGGSLSPNNALTLGSLSLLNTPSGVAVSGAGNVVIADSGVPGVFNLVRTTGSLLFGPVDTSQSSIAQTLTLTSAGTASLTLGATAYTASGSTTSFAVAPGGNSPCAAASTLTVGATCGYSATFSPTTTGPLTETLAFSTNAVNASALTAVLSGTGTNLPPTTTTLTLTPAAPYYGQPVQVTATVVPSKAGNVPTGTVTFYVDGIAQKPIAITTTSPYTATYTFPALSLTASTHAMEASYSGDNNNASSDVLIPLIITITRSPSTVTSTVTPTVSQPVGKAFSFAVSVFPAAQGAPTGTVSLVAVGTTTPVLATATLTAGTATLSYIPTGVGVYQYQAIYSGDVNFLPSTSNIDNVSVQATGYTVTLPSSAYTVTDGGSISIPITITGISGYAGNVTVGAVNVATTTVTAPCTGQPSYVTCTFSPGIVSLAGGNYPTSNPTAVINLTLSTSVPPPTKASGGYILWPGAIAGLLGLALSSRKRRRISRAMAIVIWVAMGSLALGISGCGGNSANQYATPKGTTTITLTFSGSPVSGYSTTSVVPNIVNTANITLTVQ